MNIIDFLSLPLSLPISPIWDFVICLVIGEVAYQFAYAKAGELGTSSGERTLLHWLIRVPVYFILWAIACVVILVARFIKQHWITVLIVIGAIAFIVGLCFTIRWLVKKKRTQKTEGD